ncbi:MAG: DsbA family protein [Alphaproteobacteria bacterium]|nr:MAG: DsbA family protein [Alphaproteobacteria bacterium]
MRPAIRLAAALACLLGLLGAAVPAARAQEALDAAQVKKLALEAILENPEIIVQAIDILRAREAEAQTAQAQAALAANREALFADANAPEIGNPEGDVTIVEFFDYNCPYCRRAAPEVAEVLESDGNIRLVYREWPILSQDSLDAARVALAVREQGRYGAFHDALMSLPRATGETALNLAQEMGYDMERLKADMERGEIAAHIARSRQLAQALGFTGTPSFVVGNQLVPGFVQADQLREIVATARANAAKESGAQD